MKGILGKFPKAVLIDFIYAEMGLYRYETKEHLEARLLYLQWESEDKACSREADAIMADMERFKDWAILDNRDKYIEAMEKSQRNHKRWEAVQKIYEKAQKLRGRQP